MSDQLVETKNLKKYFPSKNGFIRAVDGVNLSDRPATGVENLILQGRLHGMTHIQAKARAKELISLLQLDDFAGRIVYTYSCLLYTSPSPRDGLLSRMPSS